MVWMSGRVHCIPGMFVPSGSSHSWASSVWEKRGSRDGTYFWSMGRVQVELRKEVLPNDNATLIFLDRLWFYFLFIYFLNYLLICFWPCWVFDAARAPL